MMRCLFTGSNGFLGRNIVPLLKEEFGLIKTLDYNNADYNYDLRTAIPLFHEKFEFVIHAAGQAHFIPKNPDESRSFFDVNLAGTRNLCAGLENAGVPESIVFISTVAVYGMIKGVEITEDYPLNGKSPYAQSKIEAEFFLQDWCRHNRVKLNILRPSLIAGPNPPGNLGSMINGIKAGRYLSIDGGRASKSILIVYDFARIIPKLIGREGVFNICDSENPTFRDLELLISSQLNRSMPKTCPLFAARIAAYFGDILGGNFPLNSNKLSNIINTLTFSNSKAKKELEWEPLNVLQNFKIH